MRMGNSTKRMSEGRTYQKTDHEKSAIWLTSRVSWYIQSIARSEISGRAASSAAMEVFRREISEMPPIKSALMVTLIQKFMIVGKVVFWTGGPGAVRAADPQRFYC